ncbi:hypothetical protein RQN30_00110 [Arcanobacterium hippocoleae]
MNYFDLNNFLLNPSLSAIRTSEQHIRQWLEYELTSLKLWPDPDATVETREFYQEVWGEFLMSVGTSLRPEPTEFSKDPSRYVQGDWMCSVWTTLKLGLQLAYGKNDRGNDVWWQKPGIIDTFDENDGVTKRTYKGILNHFDEFDEVFGLKIVQEFVRSACTLANFIVVPDGFNTARSNRGTDDYWDKTMRLYFEEFNSKSPLEYTPPRQSPPKRRYDVGTPFHKLVSASIEQGDALFLSEWIDEQGQAIMLPNMNPQTFDEWLDLVREMTRRIDARRTAMQNARPITSTSLSPGSKNSSLLL